ncbi:acyl-CoA dehydrogenase family protein [Mycolicibacterium sp.]|uniref:acyl-CoA dehydrogenase family protein n=1 Tax=Mycolicibacterium sp. TaxID=2320850 RepID=UPI003D10885E
MDFGFSTEQEDFRESLRRFLRDSSPMARVRQTAGADGYDRALWRRLCDELGVLAPHAPARYDGAAGTLVDTAIAFGELGRALTPVPLAATTFAIESVLRLGDPEQRDRLLPALLSGAVVGAFTATNAHPTSTTVRAECRGSTVLTGACAPVLDGHVADLFVVPARADGEVTLHVVRADAPGVTVTRLPSFDPTRPVARLVLTRAPAEALTAGLPGAVERVSDVARVLLAAEMLGGAEACLALAVDHAKSRSQFDRPIGSFQAVKHACADMLIEIDATRVAVMFAAMTADGDQLPVTAPLTMAQAGETYLQCADSAMQVHGGIAFTWEHELHQHLRRATTTEVLFGGSAHQRALLAERVGL